MGMEPAIHLVNPTRTVHKIVKVLQTNLSAQLVPVDMDGHIMMATACALEIPLFRALIVLTHPTIYHTSVEMANVIMVKLVIHAQWIVAHV